MKKIFLAIILSISLKTMISQNHIQYDNPHTIRYEMVQFSEKINEIGGISVFSEPQKLNRSYAEIDIYTSFSTVVLYVNTEQERYYSISNDYKIISIKDSLYESYDGLDEYDDEINILIRRDKLNKIISITILVDNNTIECYQLKQINK